MILGRHLNLNLKMSSIYHDADFSICELCSGPLQIERAIKCSKCAIWHHDSCAEIEQHVLREIKMHNGLHYLCRGCNVVPFPDLQAQISVLEKKLKAQSSRVDTKFSALTNKVQNHEKMLQNRLPKRDEQQVEDIISDIIQEERKISDRRLNICVFNMRCTDNDARNFSTLCSQQLGLNESAILACIISVKRMDGNSRHNNVRKPPPLIVRLSSADCKKDILKNAHKLSNFYEQGSTLKLFITHDLTPKQQAKKNALRAELLQRRGNGETVFLRRGKIHSASNSRNNQHPRTPTSPPLPAAPSHPSFFARFGMKKK